MEQTGHLPIILALGETHSHSRVSEIQTHQCKDYKMPGNEQQEAMISMIVRLYNEKWQTSSGNAVRFMNATKSPESDPKLIFALPFSKQYVGWKKYYNDEYKTNSSLNRPVYKIPPQSYGIKSRWLALAFQWYKSVTYLTGWTFKFCISYDQVSHACRMSWRLSRSASPSWKLDSFNQGRFFLEDDQFILCYI